MMEGIREQITKPPVAAILGFVVGLFIGLVVLGWWLWPVKYTGAGPKDLRPEAKAEYLRMAIQAYAQNSDASQAKARYDALGVDASQTLQEVANNPEGLTSDQVQKFGAAVLAAPAAGEAAVPGAGGEEQTQAASPFRSLLPILCVVVLVVAAIFGALFILRGRTPIPATLSPAMQAQQAARQAAWTDYTATGAEPPMAQFMASYKLGDDLFDDSFSIDSPSGDFLGECGVGISETIGVGEPKKVTAFEVWLFDKNDIQTVTKVLMSGHAFSDETTRQRLAAKGEPVLAEPGTETVLETQTLQLVARVVEMGYGEGALPPESFYDRFILELAVWPKAA